MTAAGAEPQPWHPLRWWILFLLVLLGQLGFIFWLGERQPIVPRPAREAPELNLITEGNEELLALLDPTLFALPSERGFAGMAWRKSSQPALQELDWSAPTWWLLPDTNRLGTPFPPSRNTDFLAARRSAPMPEPELRLPQVSPPPANFVQSTLRIESQPPETRLESAVALPSWPARSAGGTEADLLTNSLVQVVLNTEGRPISATLLSGSGSSAADDYALGQARAAQFTPAAVGEMSQAGDSPLSRLRWVQLIFEWHTLPVTNAPGK
jgi:TonB family protein